MKFDILIFRKYSDKIEVSLKSDKNNGYFTWRPITFLIISRSFLLRMRNIWDKSCRENPNTHFVFNNFFFRKSFGLWANVGKYIRAGQTKMTIRRMHIACRIRKATNTHSEYVMLVALPLQPWLRERACVKVTRTYLSSYSIRLW
jgi:hypothetical protein